MNEDLAYQVLDYIREHPAEWNQDTYVCGTTACFAGHAILLDAVNRELSAKVTRLTFMQASGWVCAETARELLGWNYTQSDHVFRCYTRDFGELERRVKDVLSGEVR